MKPKYQKPFTFSILAIIVLITFQMLISFVNAAYVGHDNDMDVSAFLAKYPSMKGTSLDGCNLCHKGGVLKLDGNAANTSREIRINACDYCHQIYLYGDMAIQETINHFGIDYMKHGRSTESLAKIEDVDSDNDGYSNIDEINSGTLPGSSDSSPSHNPAPFNIISIDDLNNSIEKVNQVIFLNSHKSRAGDTYYTYGGYKLMDILDMIEIAPDSVSVDIIALDGYTKTYSIREIMGTYKQSSVVTGLSKSELGNCAWVHYDGINPEDDPQLPDANFLIANEMNGERLRFASIDHKTGKIKGHGPFRLIIPQFNNPGLPDNPQTADKECTQKLPPEYRFNESYEHNADYCVKGVVAIRVNPLPDGTMDYNWQETCGDLINQEKIVIFGNIINNS